MSSSPGWVAGYVPAPAEWNTTFANKADESEMAAKANVTDLAAKANVAGTTTNNNAGAGNVGEYVTANGSPTGISTGAQTTLASIVLGAGDWDVWGGISFSPAGSTTISTVSLGPSTVNNTLPGINGLTTISAAFVAGQAIVMPSQILRASLAVPTTYYMVGAANFAVSTMSATAFISARRAPTQAP